MADETKYLYSVKPRKPIKTLKDVPVVRTNKSLYLDKDEVRECLKCGTVYRRFTNEDKYVRVVGYSIDRLHNEKFYTEEEWKELQKGSTAGESKDEEVPPVRTPDENSNVESKAEPAAEDTHGRVNAANDEIDPADETSEVESTEDTKDQAGTEELKPEDPVESIPEKSTEEGAVSVDSSSESKDDEGDAMSAQVQVDQAADNTHSSQTNVPEIHISIPNGNYSGKKKNKHNKK